MKWKCTECMSRRSKTCKEDKGCIVEVPHLDDSSVCGPNICPWCPDTVAKWEPMNDPVDIAIEAATPRLCFWCEEPGLLNDIGMCQTCERAENAN